MNSHCSYIRFFLILTWNPLQWILANTTSVPAEDSYHWLDISTTVCDISKDITTYNVLHLFLRLELGLLHILTRPVSLVCSSLIATEGNGFQSSILFGVCYFGVAADGFSNISKMFMQVSGLCCCFSLYI